VDDGDAGDTYNYSPPDVDRIVDRPTSVHIDVLEGGPVRARLLVVATYEWAIERRQARTPVVRQV
jgi:hypothetical protein